MSNLVQDTIRKYTSQYSKTENQPAPTTKAGSFSLPYDPNWTPAALSSPVPKSVTTASGYDKFGDYYDYKVVTFPDGTQFAMTDEGKPFVTDRDVPEDLKTKIRTQLDSKSDGSFQSTGIEVDHIMSKFLGGTDVESNLQPLRGDLSFGQKVSKFFFPKKFELETSMPSQEFSTDERQAGKYAVEVEAVNKLRNGEITYWEAMAAVQHWDNKKLRNDFLHNETEEKQGWIDIAKQFLAPKGAIENATGASLHLPGNFVTNFIQDKVTTAYKKSFLNTLAQSVNPLSGDSLEERMALVRGASKGVDKYYEEFDVENDDPDKLAFSGISKIVAPIFLGPAALPKAQLPQAKEIKSAGTLLPRWFVGGLTRLTMGATLEGVSQFHYDAGMKQMALDARFTPQTEKEILWLGQGDIAAFSQSSDLYGEAQRRATKLLEQAGIDHTEAQATSFGAVLAVGFLLENPIMSLGGRATKEGLERVAKEMLEHELKGELSERVVREIADEVPRIVAQADPVAKKQMFADMVAKHSKPNSLKQADEVLVVREGVDIDVPLKQTTEVVSPLAQEAKKFDSADEFIEAQGTAVYHGTKSNIGVKDITAQSESRGQYLGNGIYFTKFKEGADLYGSKTLDAIVNEKDFLDISGLKGVDRTNKIGSFGTYKQYLKNSNLEDTAINFQKWQKNQQKVADKILNMGYKGVTDGQQHVIFDKSAIKTKSQLTDIFNKANATKTVGAETSLIQEAKKYKSADDFVKEQGTPVYHGASLENANKINAEGFKVGAGKGVSGQASGDFVYATGNKVSANKYVSDRLGIKNPTVVDAGFNGKVLEIQGKMADFEAFGEASKKLGVPLEIGSQGKPTMLNMPAIKKAMQEQGYGAISFSDRYANGTKAFAILPENIKTKSQLTDIWKQANKTDDLLSEARKFKSADEFVKAQGTPVYHGTAEGVTFDKFDLARAEKGVGQNVFDQGNQIYLTETEGAAKYFADLANQNLSLARGEFPKSRGGNVLDFYIKPKAKILEVSDMPRGNLKEVDKVINQAKGDGYDAIRFEDKGFATVEGSEQIVKEFEKLGRYPKTTIILNQEVIKTKSQLTDIWKQANEVAGKEVSKLDQVLKKNEDLFKMFDEIDPTEVPVEKAGLYLRAKKKLENGIAAFTRAFEDDWNTVRRMQEKGEGVATPWNKKKLFAGRAGTRVELVRDEVKGMIKDRLDTARKLNIDSDELKGQVNEYLVMRHAPERNKAVMGRLADDASEEAIERATKAAGVTTEQAKAKMKELEQLPYFDEVKRMADDIQEMNSRTLEILRDGQVITDELFEELTTRYKNHVPLYRIMDESEDVGKVLNSGGFDVKSTGIKTAKGSEREVADILGNVTANLDEAIARAEKNTVNLEVLKFARENNELGIFKEVKPRPIGKGFDGEKVLTDTKSLLDDPQVLTLRENGKPVYLKIDDPQLATVVKGLGREKVPQYLRWARTAVRFYSGLQTRFNPDFAFSNKIRDMQEALVYTAAQKDMGFKGAAGVVKKDAVSLKTVLDAIRGKDSEATRLYKQMQMDGGTTGGLGLSTKKAVELDLDKLERLMKSNPRKGTEYLIRKVDDWNTIFEDSTRLSVYREALDRGVSREKAAVMAKDASIDFNQMGTLGPVVNSLYMFSNASFQGSFKMVRAMKNPKVASAVALSVGGAVYAVNEWNDNLDPNWREKVSTWDRSSNMVVMLPPNDDGSANYFTLPVSWGLKPIKVTFDKAYDMAFSPNEADKDIGDAFNAIFASLIEGYNPVGGSDVYSAVTPTLGDPLLDLARNKSWSGSKIKPDWDKNLSQNRQYFDSLRDTPRGRALINTTRFFDDKVGIDISPEDLDYAYQQAVGGAGRFVGKVTTTVSGIGRGEELNPKEIPFIGRFLRRRGPDEFKNSGAVSEETQKALQEQSDARFDINEKAEIIAGELDDMTKEERAAVLADLDEEIINKIIKIKEEEALNLTYEDKLIGNLGVENGARARRIYEIIAGTDTRKEAGEIILELADKKIINDNVAEQLADLIISGELPTPLNP